MDGSEPKTENVAHSQRSHRIEIKSNTNRLNVQEDEGHEADGTAN